MAPVSSGTHVSAVVPTTNGVQDVTSFTAVTGFSNNFAVGQLWLTNTTVLLTQAPGVPPTGALFGIVNMLRATLKENPDYTAFVVDASGPTFRDELYPAYKATRSAM